MNREQFRKELQAFVDACYSKTGSDSYALGWMIAEMVCETPESCRTKLVDLMKAGVAKMNKS